MLLIAPKRKRLVAARNISRRSMTRGKAFYDNSVDAFNPQIWANASLAILFENMVMGNLVYRDFEDEIESYGNTVNTRKPREFEAKRKTNADSVIVQDAVADNIAVKLNQQVHVSYMIKDGEESIAFKSIIDEFLQPAMLANARFLDRVLSTQVYQYLSNSAGILNGVDSTNGKQAILDTRQLMNVNKAWTTNRNIVLTPSTETIFLEEEAFTDANRVGDDGTAIREASLGRKLNFNFFMGQNQPHVNLPVVGTVLQGGTERRGAINNAAGYPAGSTTFTVDGLTGAILAGDWVTIDTDGTPMQVVSTTGGSTPTVIVVTQPSRRAVADNAVVHVLNSGLVSGTYALDPGSSIGWSKEITLTGVTVAPQVGQGVTFGSDTTDIYGIISVNGLTGITLDRPLEATVADASVVHFMPGGSYNFAFHPNALALVSRPMALPKQGTGALAGRAVWNNLAVRVVITYDGNRQGHLVTIDFLMGVKPLDVALGAVLLA